MTDGSRGTSKPITSYEVAQLAGVTQPTVSRAMRGDRIAESTRLRVLAAAHQLGYVPSDAGRSLATRKTHRIGVVVVDLQNYFYLGVLAALEQMLGAEGYQVTLFRQSTDESALLAQLASGGIDGVVLTSVTLDSGLPGMLHSRGIPTVLLNRETSELTADSCVSDNLTGARLVAERMLQLGHSRIGALFGPANTSTGRDRACGFRAAMAEAGVTLPDSAVRETEYSYDAGHDGLLALIDGPTPPTAVFCANDLIAIGALNAAHKRGMEVPRDLTVIGYDDSDMAAWEVFDLTTVRQGIDQLVAAAVELLLERIADDGLAPRRVTVQPALVLRSTDGPPAPPILA